MFIKTKTKEENALDKAISIRVDQLQLIDDEDDGEKIKNVERLAMVKEKIEGPKPEPISPNTVIMAITSLLGIVAMLQYEKLDVITSKVLNFIPKARF